MGKETHHIVTTVTKVTHTQTQSLVIMCYKTKHGPSIKCQNRKRTRFVLKIENFPERQKSVKSNMIKVEVGEEEASQWILELVPGTNQDTALSASLWRTDCLSILTQAQENVPDTDTLTVECQLSVRNLRQSPNIPR